jgi:hypothetical protein
MMCRWHAATLMSMWGKCLSEDCPTRSIKEKVLDDIHVSWLRHHQLDSVPAQLICAETRVAAEMSKPVSSSHKKRKLDDSNRGKTPRHKKSKRQRIEDYHSSSDESDGAREDGFAPVNLGGSDDESSTGPSHATGANSDPVPERGERAIVEKYASERSSDSEDESDGDDQDDTEDDGEGTSQKPKNKRSDPEAFSTTISKILSTKLSQHARQDPVLSRSKQAAERSSTIANDKLEKKAKARMRAEKKEELDRGRIKDVLGIDAGLTGQVAAEEKRLRKIAQRGVVALFNAFRAAQVRGEQAAKEEQRKGTVGITNREDKVKEMSKQGFLDLINGQKKSQAA